MYVVLAEELFNVDGRIPPTLPQIFLYLAILHHFSIFSINEEYLLMSHHLSRGLPTDFLLWNFSIPEVFRYSRIILSGYITGP